MHSAGARFIGGAPQPVPRSPLDPKAPQVDFELFFAALPAASALLADGKVVRSNAALETLFAVEPGALEGCSLWDFVEGDEARQVLKARYAARLRGEPVTPQYEVLVRRPNGSRFRASVLAQTLDAVRTVLVIREVPVESDVPLASALSEVAMKVQRAQTPEAVVEVASVELRAIGLVPYISRHRDGKLELLATLPDDPMVGLMAAALGQRREAVATPAPPSLDRLATSTARARYMEDFAAVTRAYLISQGIDPAPFAHDFAAPSHARAIVAPLLVNGQVWGTLTVTAAHLQQSDTGAIALFAAQVASSLDVATSLQRLQQSNRHLAAVHDLAAAGAESELGRLVPRLLAIAAVGSECQQVALWLRENGELTPIGSHGFAPTGDDARHRFRSVAALGALFGGGARAVPLTEVPEPERSRLQAWGVRQLAVLPLAHQGREVGALHLGRANDRPFTEVDLQGGALIADQLVIQIEKARLIEAERRRVRDLQLLLDVGRLVTASLDPDEILESACANLARIVDASDAWIWLYDPLTRELRGAATSTPDFREHFRSVRMSIDAAPTAAAEAMTTRAPVRIADAQHSPIINKDLNSRYRVRSLLALPLLSRDQPIGAVSIGDRYRSRGWTEAEVERATLVASQVAVAVANARLFDDLKRSYDKLAQAREELVKRERLAALGELSAVVAHEVRNPLGVVFNSLGSLRKAVRGNADAEMLLGIVGEEADRLNRIVSDLLDFARPHEASLRLESLESVLQSARETTLALTGAREITFDVDPRLPRVALDARMLRQALINLLVNAVQASQRGTRVVLRAQMDGGRVRIDVEDAGPGIPAAHRQRIFQPFFTTKATGTGLGLAVVKRIVEAHRGEVTMTSVEGHGTTFSVWLPVPPNESSSVVLS